MQRGEWSYLDLTCSKGHGTATMRTAPTSSISMSGRCASGSIGRSGRGASRRSVAAVIGYERTARAETDRCAVALGGRLHGSHGLGSRGDGALRVRAPGLKPRPVDRPEPARPRRRRRRARLAVRHRACRRACRSGAATRVEIAQLIDASGRVLDRAPGLTRRPLLGPSAIAAARRGVITQLRLAGGVPVRLLAEAARAQDQKLVIIVGQSSEPRNGALSDLGGVLLIGGPLALPLASIAGYALTGAALRPWKKCVAGQRAYRRPNLDQRCRPRAAMTSLAGSGGPSTRCWRASTPRSPAIGLAGRRPLRDRGDRPAQPAGRGPAAARPRRREPLGIDTSSVSAAELLHQAAERASRQTEPGPSR